MIKGFKHRGLKELHRKGTSRRVPANLRTKAKRQLDALNVATRPEDMAVPGWRFHKYKDSPVWSVDVNGPWRITWEWDEGPVRVDLIQPH